MRYTTMLILMSTSLANVLYAIEQQSASFPMQFHLKRTEGLTDFTTGLFAMVVVLKLNGPAEPLSPWLFCGTLSEGLSVKDARVGLRRLEPSVFKEPLCGGKLSTNGDKESLSCAPRREELSGALGGSSGGGVGVRGGRGIGRFDAICTRQINGACAEPRIWSSEECYSVLWIRDGERIKQAAAQSKR